VQIPVSDAPHTAFTPSDEYTHCYAGILGRADCRYRATDKFVSLDIRFNIYVTHQAARTIDDMDGVAGKFIRIRSSHFRVHRYSVAIKIEGL